MQHSIEELIRRINTMHDLEVQAHLVRNEFAEISYKEYDKVTCQNLIDDIQSIARGIANDTQGNEIKTEMDEWKK